MRISGIAIIFLFVLFPFLSASLGSKLLKADIVLSIVLIFEMFVLMGAKTKKKWFYISNFRNVYRLTWEAEVLYLITVALGFVVFLYFSMHTGGAGVFFRVLLVLVPSLWISTKATRKTQKFPWYTIKIKKPSL